MSNSRVLTVWKINIIENFICKDRSLWYDKGDNFFLIHNLNSLICVMTFPQLLVNIPLIVSFRQAHEDKNQSHFWGKLKLICQSWR